MDFYVVMGRAGARVTRRKRARSTIGNSHKTNKEDTIQWFKTRYDAEVLDK